MPRTALVTGGASGLGAASAARLRAEGLTVITLDVSGPADVAADVTDEAALRQAAGRNNLLMLSVTPSQSADGGASSLRSNVVRVSVDASDIRSLERRIETRFQAAQGETFDKFVGGIALGRAETPDDVAGCVSFLAGPDATYITGQSIVIDGGLIPF